MDHACSSSDTADRTERRVALPSSSADAAAPQGAARSRTLLHVAWTSGTALFLLVLVLLGPWRRGDDTHRYRTVAVDHGPIAAKVTANGTLSALVTVSVGSQVSGRIETLGADFGSRVTAGQVIATLESSLFEAIAAQAEANHRAARAAIERARAQLENARRQHERATLLRNEGLTTGVDYDTAAAALRVARAELELSESNAAQTLAARDQAELNLRYATIVSPIDGTVLSRNVDVGQTVAATLQAPTLFTIARDLGQMQVDTAVPEADVGKVRAGMSVSFSVDSYPEQTFSGVVRQVRDNPQTVQNVVTYDAVVDVGNPELKLKPGMTATVTFTYRESPAALRVPNAAFRFQPDAELLTRGRASAPAATPGRDTRSLWLLRDGAPQAVSVRVGITDGSATEILAGDLSAGDQVIVEALPEGSNDG